MDKRFLWVTKFNPPRGISLGHIQIGAITLLCALHFTSGQSDVILVDLPGGGESKRWQQKGCQAVKKSSKIENKKSLIS